MSNRFKKLSHTIYECKYHIVFCPKYRFRIFCVSTIGLNEEQVRKYVKWQEKKEKEIEKRQLDLFE